MKFEFSTYNTNRNSKAFTRHSITTEKVNDNFCLNERKLLHFIYSLGIQSRSKKKKRTLDCNTTKIVITHKRPCIPRACYASPIHFHINTHTHVLVFPGNFSALPAVSLAARDSRRSADHNTIRAPRIAAAAAAATKTTTSHGSS